MENLVLSIVIPSFNGEKYIDNCLHSIINDRVIQTGAHKYFEIIFVNDGSKDNTGKIIEKKAKIINEKSGKNILTYINKENGQYGSVINLGLKKAKGKYFKVLDVDDSFSTEDFIKLIYILKGINDPKVDIILTDHTFEKIRTNKKLLQSLRKYIEPYKIGKIEDLNLPNDIVTMHSIIYRTNHLREIDFEQLEGVYYSDSQFSLIPLLKSKKYYYANLPLYRYYIGREDQSINIKSMVKNKKDQQLVFETMVSEVNFHNIKKKNLKKYARIIIRRMLQWNLLIVINDNSLQNKRKAVIDLFKFTRKKFPDEYKQITSGFFFIFIKISRAYGISHIMTLGAKIYSKFKKNIMSDWD